MSSDRPSSSDRLFTWLLRLLPREFRGDFGEQMADDFRDQREAVQANGRRFARSGLWARTVAGIIRQALLQHVDVLGRDVQYAARLLARRPAFSLTAILTLTLGIGGTTAVFSLLHAPAHQTAAGRAAGRARAPGGAAAGRHVR